jgi:hypothetical protein
MRHAERGRIAAQLRDLPEQYLRRRPRLQRGKQRIFLGTIGVDVVNFTSHA